MPPKGWRKTASGFQPTNSSGVSIKDRKIHGIEELLLPRTLIAKIAKQSLPENSPLPKDGVTALMRSATMFISFITSEASSFALSDNRKTVTHLDILKALELCNFGTLVGPTSELSEALVSQKQTTPAANTSFSTSAPNAAQATNSETPVGEEGELVDVDDDYIEEDVEPEIEPLQIVAYNFKKARTATAEASSEGEMQVE